MVGPGEVDDMLCGETARECMKYGNVLECEVWESPHNLIPEEAVRIFVKFEKVEQALQALIDLDGRFFAGRNVKADYYPKEKFTRMEFDAPI
jgi:splicing factor 45